MAPPVDPSIVHVDITQIDLRKTPTLELEYQSAANIIRQARELGAKVIAFDVIFGRGDQAMADPILKEIETTKAQNKTVILAEALLPSPEDGKEERVRSFPYRDRALPAGLINVRADSDGVLRRYDYVHRNGVGNDEPSLGLASYLAWRELAWESSVTFPKRDVLRWEELSSDFTTVEPRELKLETILLNYRSPWTGKGPAAFRHYNVAQLEDLYQTSHPSNAQPLANAIVLVSYYGAGLGDMGTTSIAPNQPRVVLHSTALNDLIQRSWLRRTMSLYFSPHIMEHVLQNPGSMEPQEAEITVLLTDLRNSTVIAELLGPPGMFQLLNQVFETQTRAILAEDGSMEHFLGDQFLSYWGAPDVQPDATDRAFRASLSLITGMEGLRTNLEPNLKTLFGYGVALHSGTALIGNKGSAQRLDYGLVGDLINAAARVESLTKYYGVLFLITREAYAKLSASPKVRLIDKAIVKGKSTPLELLEIKHAHSPEHFDDTLERYSAAFASYERGDFRGAEQIGRASCRERV